MRFPVVRLGECVRTFGLFALVVVRLVCACVAVAGLALLAPRAPGFLGPAALAAAYSAALTEKSPQTWGAWPEVTQPESPLHPVTALRKTLICAETIFYWQKYGVFVSLRCSTTKRSRTRTLRSIEIRQISADYLAYVNPKKGVSEFLYIAAFFQN